jgi:hypothetical protein
MLQIGDATVYGDVGKDLGYARKVWLWGQIYGRLQVIDGMWMRDTAALHHPSMHACTVMHRISAMYGLETIISHTTLLCC